MFYLVCLDLLKIRLYRSAKRCDPIVVIAADAVVVVVTAENAVAAVVVAATLVALAVVAVVLVVAGIAAYYHFDQSPLIARVGAVIAGSVAGVVIFWTAAMGKEFFAYAQESIDEAKRVVWPTRKETLITTGMVFVMAIFAAVFFLLSDMIIHWAVGLILGFGR